MIFLEFDDSYFANNFGYIVMKFLFQDQKITLLLLAYILKSKRIRNRPEREVAASVALIFNNIDFLYLLFKHGKKLIWRFLSRWWLCIQVTPIRVFPKLIRYCILNAQRFCRQQLSTFILTLLRHHLKLLLLLPFQALLSPLRLP